MQSPNVPKTHFRHDIEGLRAVAVMAVVVFHLNKGWLPGGYIGVDVFFVLSGYLIVTVVLRQISTGQFSLMQFALSRVKRLMPALAVMLFVVNGVALVLMTAPDFRSFWISAASAFLYVSNILFGSSFDYFGPAAHELPLLHSWSLSVEMHLYIISALVLLLFNTVRAQGVFLATILGCLIWTELLLSGGASQFAYFATFTRAPEFLIGSVVGILHHRKLTGFLVSRGGLVRMLQAVSIAALVASFVWINPSVPFPGVMALPPVLATAILVYFGTQGYGRFFAARPLVFIGGLSYSIYLWHWPILALLRYYSSDYYLTGTETVLAALLISISSYVSFRWVETPCRRLTFDGARGVLRGIGMTALAGVVLAAGFIGGAYVNRILAPEIDITLTRYADGDEVCHGHRKTDCARGTVTSLPPISLVGDSHAGMLNLFADEVSKVLGRQIIVVSGSNCVTIEGFDLRRIPDRVQEECGHQIAQAALAIQQSEYVIVAGKWNYHSESATFMSALNNFLSARQAEQKAVLILAQIPQVDQNAQRNARFTHLGIAPQAVAFAASQYTRRANDLIAKVAAQHDGATFLDMTSLSLFAREPYSAGNPIYYDLSHLNELGARLYGQQAAPCIKSWISAPSASLDGCFDG